MQYEVHLGAGIANLLEANKPQRLKCLWEIQKDTTVTSSLWTATLCRTVFFHSQSKTKTG